MPNTSRSSSRERGERVRHLDERAIERDDVRRDAARARDLRAVGAKLLEAMAARGVERIETGRLRPRSAARPLRAIEPAALAREREPDRARRAHHLARRRA